MSIEAAGWQWAELDPLTRIVVAAFAWRIGDVSKGDLSGEAFMGAMAEAFDDMTAENITKTVGWGGPDGMRNAIADRLSGSAREPVASTIQRLGRLAGGTEAVMALAAQAGKQLRRKDAYDAIPALRVLSDMAIERR